MKRKKEEISNSQIAKKIKWAQINNFCWFFIVLMAIRNLKNVETNIYSLIFIGLIMMAGLLLTFLFWTEEI